MGITDELREYASTYDGVWVSPSGSMTWSTTKDYKPDDDDWQPANSVLLAIADRIDAEHEKVIASVMNDALCCANDKDMAELGWILLPKDANDEYICPGDVLDGYGKTIEVVELRYGRSGWVLISRDGNGYADTFAFVHHHKPTVKDVLREFAMAVCKDDALTIRKDVVDQYAAKLRLANCEEEL